MVDYGGTADIDTDLYVFFFSSRRRHTRCGRDWSSDVCSSDLVRGAGDVVAAGIDAGAPVREAFERLREIELLAAAPIALAHEIEPDGEIAIDAKVNPARV